MSYNYWNIIWSIQNHVLFSKFIWYPNNAKWDALILILPIGYFPNVLLAYLFAVIFNSYTVYLHSWRAVPDKLGFSKIRRPIRWYQQLVWMPNYACVVWCPSIIRWPVAFVFRNYEATSCLGKLGQAKYMHLLTQRADRMITDWGCCSSRYSSYISQSIAVCDELYVILRQYVLASMGR